MSKEAFQPTNGGTSLTAEEERDLVIGVANRAELNAFERENILEARIWALRERIRSHNDLLTEDFLRELHHRMFRRVWRWAGKYRATERNLGVPLTRLHQDMRLLIDDARYWLAEGTYPVDEIAIRFHHRLVAIHPWPNGNGRHARLMADVLMCRQGRKPLTWGAGASLAESGAARERYLAALHAADEGDIQPLLLFAHS